MNIINETHAGNQRHRQQEPDVVPDFQIQRRNPPCRSKSQPDPQCQKKNNPTATQDNAGVRLALIRFVNDVKLVRDAEINHLRRQQDDENNDVFHVDSHSLTHCYV